MQDAIAGVISSKPAVRERPNFRNFFLRRIRFTEEDPRTIDSLTEFRLMLPVAHLPLCIFCSIKQDEAFVPSH